MAARPKVEAAVRASYECDVGTAQAVATSASATELVLFLFLDDDELHPPSWGVRRRRPEN